MYKEQEIVNDVLADKNLNRTGSHRSLAPIQHNLVFFILTYQIPRLVLPFQIEKNKNLVSSDKDISTYTNLFCIGL